MRKFDSLYENLSFSLRENRHQSLTFKDNVAAVIKLAIDEKFRPDLKQKTWKELDKIVEEAVRTRSFLLYTTTPSKPLVKLEFKERGVPDSFYVAAIDLSESDESPEKVKEFNGFTETIFDDIKQHIKSLATKYANPANAVEELPASNTVTPEQAAAAGVPATEAPEGQAPEGSALPK